MSAARVEIDDWPAVLEWDVTYAAPSADLLADTLLALRRMPHANRSATRFA